MAEKENKNKKRKKPTSRRIKFVRPSSIKGSKKKKSNSELKNRNSTNIINTTALDKDHLGNVGKFVKMDDTELEDHIPKGGKGVGNTLTDDERDSRLVLVHRMHLRGFNNQEIAEKLQVSTRMVCKIKVKIKEVHKRSFTNVDINEWVGGTMAFFDEVRNMAMQMSSLTSNTTKDRLLALNVATNSEMNKNRFLEYCGVFKYIQQNQGMVTEIIEHRGNSEKDKDEVQAAMDSFALELFQNA